MTGSLHLGNDTDTALLGVLDNVFDVLDPVDVAGRVGTLGSKLRVLFGDVRERGRVKHVPVENVELVPGQGYESRRIHITKS